MELHKYNQRYNYLISYIDRCEGEEVNRDILSLSKSVIESLLSVIRDRDKFLLIPDACPGENNDFMYI